MKIKQLQWEAMTEESILGFCRELEPIAYWYESNITSVTCYTIWHTKNNRYKLLYGSVNYDYSEHDDLGDFDCVKSAKEFAQQHFEKFILSWIEE